jgi:hypothetical protein
VIRGSQIANLPHQKMPEFQLCGHKQLTWLCLAVSSVLVTICGCSTPNQKQLPLEQSLNLEIRIHRGKSPPTAADQAKMFVRSFMMPVPGGINGDPAGKRINDLQVHGAEFSVSLNDIESGLAAAASPATARGDLIAFDPPDTRVARLGTFAINENKPTIRYRTGLRDPLSGHLIVLIYVDRPCSIHGMNFDLVLTHPGLQWLEALDRPDILISNRKAHLKVRDGLLDAVYDLAEPTD